MAKKPNKQDETPVINIAGNSKQQPDFSKVSAAFAAIIAKIQTHSVPLTPWHIEESTRVINALTAAKDNLVVVIISSFEKVLAVDDVAQAYEMLTTFVRPENSKLHSEVPCPSAFMQRENLLIDKINADLDEHTKDPNFWWQPVTNPVAYMLVQSVNELKSKASVGHGVDFCHIKNKI